MRHGALISCGSRSCGEFVLSFPIFEIRMVSLCVDVVQLSCGSSSFGIVPHILASSWCSQSWSPSFRIVRCLGASSRSIHLIVPCLSSPSAIWCVVVWFSSSRNVGNSCVALWCIYLVVPRPSELRSTFGTWKSLCVVVPYSS